MGSRYFANRKVVLVLLNNLLDDKGKLLFKLKELCVLAENEDPKKVKQYLEDFHDKNRDFILFLFRGKVENKLEVEVKDGKFRIITSDIQTDWLADTKENRKVMLVVFRSLCDQRGRHLFTYDDLKVILTSETRQAAGHLYDEFRDSGKDFSSFLKRKKKIDDEDLIGALSSVLRQKPLLPEVKLVCEVEKIFGQGEIGRTKVRNSLEAIGCQKILQILRKQLESGKVSYKEDSLIEKLFELIDTNISKVEIEKDIKLKELAAKPIPSFCREQKIAKDIEFLFEEKKPTNEELANIWDSPLGWKLLAFVLYFHGISLSVIGAWFGVHKSTICRWLENVSHWANEWIDQQKAIFSGKVAIDEKWIKVGNSWWYLFAAVDCVTNYPLLVSLHPSNSENYCRLFLAKLKMKGYYPKLIITDGWNAYINSIKTVFPKAEHCLCQFHLLHSVYVRMRKVKVFSTHIVIMVGSVFQTLYKRTVYRRIEKLKKSLEPSLVEPVLSGLFSKLPKAIKAVGYNKRPRTANCVEHFFGKFDRFYRLKGPFCDESSAQKHVRLFMLGYLFAIKANGKPSPLENSGCDIEKIAFYHLFNKPNLMALKRRIAQQYKNAA